MKKNEFLKQDKHSEKIIVPLLRGRDISRYSINYKKLYIIKAEIGLNLEEYPFIYKHLKKYKAQLSKRTDFKPNIMKWYNLRPCAYYDEFEKPKIIYPDISENGGFYWDEEGYYFNNTVYMIAGKVKKSWVAILNSKLMSWYYKQIASGLGVKAVRYFTQFMKELPIPEKTDYLEKYVDDMLALNKKLHETTDEKMKHIIQKQIEITDKKIDALVYELYGLTEEEIKVVEEENE